MNKHTVISTLLVLIAFSFQTVAKDQGPPAQWVRSDAMAAVRAINIEVATAEIGDISSLADGPATLKNLKNMETRADWPIPAREAAIYQFTRSLNEMPRDAVAPEVMQHLHKFQAKTLVPHEDHPGANVPLFNIRAAAAGVENSWQRAESAAEAVVLLESDPEALVFLFQETLNHNQRSGYLDALRDADVTGIEAVQTTVLQRINDSPDLTSLLAVTAVTTRNIHAAEQLLINGRGAGVSSALTELGGQLQSSELSALLIYAIQEAPASNATLAIAAWWPGLKHERSSRELLVSQLSDPKLGSSAALALAQSPDIQTIKDLQDTAEGDSVAAKRARLALEINRARLLGEETP